MIRYFKVITMQKFNNPLNTNMIKYTFRWNFQIFTLIIVIPIKKSSQVLDLLKASIEIISAPAKIK